MQPEIIMHVLSNDWWTWVWANYNMTILGVPTALSFLLKLIAIFHPNVTSNKVMDLIADYWPKGKPATGP